MRINVFRLHLPCSMSSFIQKLALYKNDKNLGYGIRSKSFDDERYNGVFFQKIIVNNHGTDIEGNTIPIHYEYFQNFNFEVLKLDSVILLLVYNAPKSIKLFLNLFSDIAEIGFYFFDDEINLKEISKIFSKFPDFKVLKAKYTNVSILNRAVANIEITSPKNAIVDFDEFYEAIDSIIVKIKIRYLENGQFITLEINNKGCISIDDDDFPKHEIEKIMEIIYFKSRLVNLVS